MVSRINGDGELSDSLGEDPFFQFRLMSPQQFMDFVDGNPRDSRAYDYLFEISDSYFFDRVLKEAERREYYFSKGLK